MRGFKSYKDQTTVEPFSPKHNVVVGENGAGKSNFFVAIMFVLSDKYTNLRQDERQALLHEGAGPAVVNAFVEIVFDNADNRFPTDREDVSIRRSIGLKKDEYLLDGKHVTKNDIMNLLESAGFSKSNPYYIVQQGKVTALTNSRDGERLELLMEVAGTKVYDQRRQESLKIMDETKGRLEKINETLKYIEDRIAELEEEKEELKEFQRLDKERRSLEYTLHDKALHRARQQLEEIETERLEHTEKTKDLYNKAESGKVQRKELEQELKVLRQELERLTHARDELEEERIEAMKQRAQTELRLRDSTDRTANEETTRTRLQSELRDLNKNMKQQQQELNRTIPQFNEAVNREERLKAELKDSERRRDELYAKQSRSRQFKSVADRNKFLKTELKQIESSTASHQKQIKECTKEIEQTTRHIEVVKRTVTSKNKQLEEQRPELDRLQTEYQANRERRDECMNRRKDMWRKEDEVKLQVNNLRQALRSSEKQLELTMPKDIQTAVEALKRIVAEEKIRGYFGPMIELIEVDEKFRTCVEVAAGNNLFNVIVDTDETAAKLLKIVNERRLGRLTMTPLSVIRNKDVTYPASEDVLPMVEHITYSNSIRKAIQQVFSKVLICRSLEVATKFAGDNGLDCVTLEGHVVNRRNAITGGYVDQTLSRLSAMASIKAHRQQLEQVEKESNELRAQQEALEQAVTQVVTDLQKQETVRARLKDQLSTLSLEISDLKKELHNLEASLEAKQRLLTSVEAASQQLQASAEAVRREMATDELDGLSSAELGELDSVVKAIEGLQEQLIASSKERAEIESRKSQLETTISTYSEARKHEIEMQLQQLGDTVMTEGLDNVQHQLDGAERNLSQVMQRQEEVQESIKEKQVQAKAKKAELEQLKAVEMQYESHIRNESKDMERLVNRITQIKEKKDEATKKIRNLGALPADTFEAYKNQSSKALLQRLEVVHESLTKYGHVNKKALEQYTSFTDQRDTLLQRKEELDQGDSAIQELIEHLDQQKDEAIERTFKTVASHFQQVFAELVPGGVGKLTMQKKVDQQEDEEDVPRRGRGRASDSQQYKYSGVKIKVSFSGSSDAYQDMHQLSGGQKTVVALSLIFAIQRCDPAPFYLFDEIDAALDSQYRTAVANLIHRNSAQAQFITTTFRAEMLQTADKFYGVYHKHKVSRILNISREEARKIIEKIPESTVVAGRPASQQKRSRVEREEDRESVSGMEE
eukprot:GILJ01007683.1.p1 GENE.GILJ01007683.1~~GILJ01007683.1.p1  ORF type:complete len:1223 (+),score=303.09 GILJ01007683.1:1-3669(+)